MKSEKLFVRSRGCVCTVPNGATPRRPRTAARVRSLRCLLPRTRRTASSVRGLAPLQALACLPGQVPQSWAGRAVMTTAMQRSSQR